MMVLFQFQISPYPLTNWVKSRTSKENYTRFIEQALLGKKKTKILAFYYGRLLSLTNKYKNVLYIEFVSCRWILLMDRTTLLGHSAGANGGTG